MKNKKMLGFTLIELMVVITIIAILATMGLNTFVTAQKKARDAKRIAEVRDLATALSTTSNLVGTLRALDTPEDATLVFGETPADPHTNCSLVGAKCVNFYEAVNKTWPIFPRGVPLAVVKNVAADRAYTVTYSLTTNKACVCAPLESKDGGNAQAKDGCSQNGLVVVNGTFSPPACVAAASGVTCNYYCVTI